MALTRALRNGIVAFVVAYVVASRVGDPANARRVAGATGAAVLLAGLLRGRGTDGDEQGAVDDADEERVAATA